MGKKTIKDKIKIAQTGNKIPVILSLRLFWRKSFLMI